MFTVGEIAALLDEKFPSDTALSFDNVGLLVGRKEKIVRKVLVALDVTTEVVREAKELSADLIVSHHPVIFREMKKVTDESYTGTVVLSLVENGLSVISLHTNYDRADEGNNYNFARKLGARDFTLTEDGFAVEYETERAMPLEEFARLVRSALSDSAIRTIGSGEVKKVIAACGAGISEGLILRAKETGAVIVTADVKHNYASMAADLGVRIVETTHYASEWAFVKSMADFLAERLDGVEVLTSRHNINPYA